MGFEEVIKENFDRVVKEVEYVKKTYNALKVFGFNDDNSIASVCVCRDEISQTIRSIIKHIWGEAFNFSSLCCHVHSRQDRAQGCHARIMLRKLMAAKNGMCIMSFPTRQSAKTARPASASAGG